MQYSKYTLRLWLTYMDYVFIFCKDTKPVDTYLAE